MAISSKIAKSIVTTSGATATHWMIRRIMVDPINKTGSLSVAGFVSQAAQTAGASILDDRSYNLVLADLQTIFLGGKDFISGAYDWLVSNTSDFSGGVVT